MKKGNIPNCCVGCKNAHNNMCHKPNYCLWYRFISKLIKRYRNLPKVGDYDESNNIL